MDRFRPNAKLAIALGAAGVVFAAIVLINYLGYATSTRLLSTGAGNFPDSASETVAASEAQPAQSLQLQSVPQLRDSALKIQVVATGLSYPTSMAFLDNNSILVLQKNDGRVFLISTNSTAQPKQVLQVSVDNSSERGLLGIAVGNNTDGGKRVFLYYTENVNGDMRNRIYRYDWNQDHLENPKLILDLPGSPGPNHDGGKMVIGKDGSLYAVIGDLNRQGEAQNNKSGGALDGTSAIFRINQSDGSPAKGNPFIPLSGASNGNILGKYFAYGIRNSFGLAIDPITGYLWDTENGQDSFDEMNLVKPGFNSGWNKIMGPIADSGKSVNDLVRLGGSHYSDPVFSWKQEIAPTAITFLNSSRLGQSYANNIFVGDYLTGNLYYFKLNANRTGLDIHSSRLADGVADNHDELIPVTFGIGFEGRISDLQTGPDGCLYVLSFGGEIFRIAPQS